MFPRSFQWFVLVLSTPLLASALQSLGVPAATGVNRANRIQTSKNATNSSRKAMSVSSDTSENKPTESAGGAGNNKALRVLFLSADTGGGHRASAEALARQFERNFPGSTYDLVDVWTLDGVYPYKKLVDSYKYLSANPSKWKWFYHFSNTAPNGFIAKRHSGMMCEKRIRKRIAAYDPDVVVSVHPAMNNAPRDATRKLSKKYGKHIPFFTVVTDLGSGHSMWFDRDVEKVYVASDRLQRLAKRRGRTPDHKIVMTGLPIRHEFAVQAEKMGDRTTEHGKEYQKQVREDLAIDTDKKTILVMGGGEGVGSLSDIVNELYAKLTLQGINATILVVCGRNEKLKNELNQRDWEAVLAQSQKPKLHRLFHRKFRNKAIQDAMDRAQNIPKSEKHGNVDVVGLGFVTNMDEYMVASDVLVSKAGPGTIAEAAAVGLPIMMTSFLPGQEAGNVEVVLDAGFGEFCTNPTEIAQMVACWLLDEGLLATMSKRTAQVGHPTAAAEIVQDIGEVTHAWMEVNSASNNGIRTSIIDYSG